MTVNVDLLAFAEERAAARFRRETNGNVNAPARGCHVNLADGRQLCVLYRMPSYPFPREGFCYQVLDAPGQKTPGRYLTRDEALTLLTGEEVSP